MALKYDMYITDLFIDRPAIQRAISRSKKGPLIKAGAYTRRAARSRIKKVSRPKKGFSKNKTTRKRQKARLKDAAPAGQAAKSRSPEPNLRTIFFVWDASLESVVCGPVEFRARKTDRTAPDIHERGGSVVIKVGKKNKRVKANYKKRPVMGPSAEDVASKMPAMANNFIGP